MSDQKTAWALLDAGRDAEALPITTRLVSQPAPTCSALIAHATALRALGRTPEALPFNHTSTRLYPKDPFAWYNLAATLGDLDLGVESDAAIRRALSLGMTAPEAVLVLSRALQLQHRYDEAERAFRLTLERRPDYTDALRDYSQLIWMRTADLSLALQPIDKALAAAPGNAGLHYLRAVVQEAAGDLDAAAASLAQGLGHAPLDLGLLTKASHVAAARGEPQAALTLARQAVAAAPQAPSAHQALCLACLADGQAEQAAAIAAELLNASPFDQLALAMQATALRLLGDPRYGQLYDYEGLVGAYTLDTPDGWPDLPSFLADLARSLEGQHQLQSHPLQQSLRHGSQAHTLLASTDPVIRAFFTSAGKVIARHQAAIDVGQDPLRVRNTGPAAILSAWSVRFGSTGFHVDHIHQQGWLSTAFYVQTPDTALATPGREGWLKFGEPGVPTKPALGPEHFVKPQPGLLVVFPSYMWHGTVPFTSDESRMSIAFDVAAPV